MFGISKPSTEQRVNVLRQESQGILSIFTSTKERLETVNDDMKDLSDELSSKIVELDNQRAHLSTQAGDNQKVIDKINQFLSE